MNLQLSETDLLNMESRKRAALINSLSGFKSASLIGTINHLGHSNLAIFSSVFHLGSNPALVGFINRPDSVERHTLNNILDTKKFTINHINRNIFKEAHQTSARYSKEVSEFDVTGLTVEYLLDFNAPFVKESSIKFGLEFAERLDLSINGTIMIIGKIKKVIIPSDCLLEDGTLEIEKAGTITIAGLDSYHATQKLARLSYAKTEMNSFEI